uniref:SH2 domain-containing protein n=1 Tax=Oryzias sinensis TaxID=183150 RepID=A0A8C7WUD8_9TELE
MASALPECYHGPLSKAECEELLAKKNKDGAYLIRDSETIQGAMCLCVTKQKSPWMTCWTLTVLVWSTLWLAVCFPKGF